MIKAIEGSIRSKEPAYVVLKTAGGVSYGIHISLFTSASLDNKSSVELEITQIIREDTNSLYGFLNKLEQKMFEMLIKLNGIGASTAMAICSSLSPNDFQNAIINGDTKTLQKVPGIGAKSARRIITELSDSKTILADNMDTKHKDAMLALSSLGFKQDKIMSVLAGIDGKDSAEIIKSALKKLA